MSLPVSPPLYVFDIFTLLVKPKLVVTDGRMPSCSPFGKFHLSGCRNLLVRPKVSLILLFTVLTYFRFRSMQLSHARLDLPLQKWPDYTGSHIIDR